MCLAVSVLCLSSTFLSAALIANFAVRSLSSGILSVGQLLLLNFWLNQTLQQSVVQGEYSHTEGILWICKEELA